MEHKKTKNLPQEMRLMNRIEIMNLDDCSPTQLSIIRNLSKSLSDWCYCYGCIQFGGLFIALIAYINRKSRLQSHQIDIVLFSSSLQLPSRSFFTLSLKNYSAFSFPFILFYRPPPPILLHDFTLIPFLQIIVPSSFFKRTNRKVDIKLAFLFFS